jgi:hypothetical protein
MELKLKHAYSRILFKFLEQSFNWNRQFYTEGGESDEKKMLIFR